MPKKIFYLYSVANPSNPKFKHLKGKPRMSYSAKESWKEDKYRGEFIAQKFLGIEVPAGMFADFGTGCGTYIELNGDMSKAENKEDLRCMEMLSEFDKSVLDKVERESTDEYEREIYIERENYCLVGYIDRCSILGDGSLHVRDYKTGNDTDKPKFYASPKYNQTVMYSYALEEEGETVGKCDVELLHRKGNSTDKDSDKVLRLSGTSQIIDTPYTKERALKFLEEEMDIVAMEISDRANFLKKFFGWTPPKIEE